MNEDSNCIKIYCSTNKDVEYEVPIPTWLLISTAVQRACKPRAWSASAKCGVQWLGELRAGNMRRLRVRVRWARGGRRLRA